MRKLRGKPVKEYRNFQLNVKYVYEPERPGNAIDSACLYRGPLASAVARHVSRDKSEKKLVDDLSKVDGKAGKVKGATASVDAGDHTAQISPDFSEGTDEEDFLLHGGDGEKGVGNEKRAEIEQSSGDRAVIRNNDYVLSGSADSRLCASTSESDVFSLTSASDVFAAETSQEALLVTTNKDCVLEMLIVQSPSHETVFKCAHFFLAPQLVVDGGFPVSTTDSEKAGASPTDRSFKAKKKDLVTSLTFTHVTGTALVS